jgi:hypothetical protein
MRDWQNKDVVMFNTEYVTRKDGKNVCIISELPIGLSVAAVRLWHQLTTDLILEAPYLEPKCYEHLRAHLLKEQLDEPLWELVNTNALYVR